VKREPHLPSKDCHNFSDADGGIEKKLTSTWGVLGGKIRYIRMTGGFVYSGVSLLCGKGVLEGKEPHKNWQI